jgi:hypothetical protein
MPPVNPRKKTPKPHWPSYARSLKREAKSLSSSGACRPLINRALKIEEPYYRAQALAWIGGFMANAGLSPESTFTMAIGAAKDVEQEWRRSEILVLVAREMSKAKEGDLKNLIELISSLKNVEKRQEAFKAIKRLFAQRGVDITDILKEYTSSRGLRKKASEIPKPAEKLTKDFQRKSRITLGLYNTYEGKKLKDIHIRAIARAAPLCYAFDLNLCLFGFPIKNGEELISILESETQIGGKGALIRTLFEGGRLLFLDAPSKTVVPELGVLVATTSNPDPRKKSVLNRLSKPFCVLMGLGGKGLPKSLLTLSSHHVELTGRNVSLETCTAMGVLAAKLERLK